ncbi:hypothetical protein A6F57_19720 [Alteromonas stellipolaris]|uniref:hypothetical protein n=1 Tax=Alteromonas stellipolaris TaxID=233316 RepID=UPI0007B432D5|nr:hypothetical protein [Alteromonas stellipolaris]ANB27210.1 hypothetical protein A6F57_19720 [Alteromonas stellipolaris]
MYNLQIFTKNKSLISEVDIDSPVVPKVGEEFFCDDSFLSSSADGMKHFLVIDVSHVLNLKEGKTQTFVEALAVSSTGEGVSENRNLRLLEHGWLNKD